MLDSTMTPERGRTTILSATPKTIRDSLTRRGDRFDAFTLNFSARSRFNVEMTSFKKGAKIDLELLDRSGRVIAIARRLTGLRAGSRNTEVRSLQVLDLSAGTYFLRTTLKRGDRSNYQLRCSTSLFGDASPVVPPPTPGRVPDGSETGLLLGRTPTGYTAGLLLGRDTTTTPPVLQSSANLVQGTLTQPPRLDGSVVSTQTGQLAPYQQPESIGATTISAEVIL